MTVQIIGTRKCSHTRKAERFFKERGIKIHLVDLRERGLSKGELENITRKIDTEDLIDTACQEYGKRGLEYMIFDPLEELLKHPLLMKTPVVRYGNRVTVGYSPEEWKPWLTERR